MTRDWTNEYWNIPDDAKDSFEELKKELSDARKYQAIQNDDIARLKKLLKGCKEIIDWYKADSGYVDLPTENILKQIEMLQNPENVTENVVNTESQHPEE